ncbi:MAG: hypothetical protein WCA13_17895, partial [Terriglobales bacterium]
TQTVQPILSQRGTFMAAIVVGRVAQEFIDDAARQGSIRSANFGVWKEIFTFCLGRMRPYGTSSGSA